MLWLWFVFARFLGRQQILSFAIQYTSATTLIQWPANVVWGGRQHTSSQSIEDCHVRKIPSPDRQEESLQELLSSLFEGVGCCSFSSNFERDPHKRPCRESAHHLACALAFGMWQSMERTMISKPLFFLQTFFCFLKVLHHILC